MSLDSHFDYTAGTKFAGNFKTIFGKASDIALNLSTPYRARVRKRNDFTGKNMTRSASLSLGGGYGSGANLPTTDAANEVEVTISRKETYGKYLMDRKTLIAGSDDKGSFRRSDKRAVKGVVDSMSLNLERMCFGQESLGVIDSGGVTDNGDGTYDLVISSATWIQANFLLYMFVNIESGNTDLFQVTSIDAANRTIVVARKSGIQVPAATDDIYVQGSEGNEAVGYADVFDATVTSLFGVTKQSGWEGHRVNAASATISNDLLADAMIDMHSTRGVAPNEIHCSVTQFKKLLASVSDPQFYIGVAKNQEYKMSYKGLSLLSPVTNEEIPVFINRFIHNTKVYLINNEESEILFAPRFGWFEEGPQRLTGTTKYEYPYGGEWAHFFHPAHQAEIHTLAT